MQLQQIRNQMWVVANGQPLRKAQENEVKRWATVRLIETLKGEPVVMQPPTAKTA